MASYTVTTGAAVERVGSKVIEFDFTVGGVTYHAKINRNKLDGATLQEQAVKLAQWVLDQRPLPGGTKPVTALANRTLTVTTRIEQVWDELSGRMVDVEKVDSVTVG